MTVSSGLLGMQCSCCRCVPCDTCSCSASLPRMLSLVIELNTAHKAQHMPQLLRYRFHYNFPFIVHIPSLCTYACFVDSRVIKLCNEAHVPHSPIRQTRGAQLSTYPMRRRNARHCGASLSECMCRTLTSCTCTSASEIDRM